MSVCPVPRMSVGPVIPLGITGWAKPRAPEPYE